MSYMDPREYIAKAIELSRSDNGPLVELFDPRLGTDYRIPSSSGESGAFSSIEQDCVVIRISWAKSWSVGLLSGLRTGPFPAYLFENATMQELLRQHSDRGFAGVYPARSVQQLTCFSPAQVRLCGEFLFSCFGLNEHTIRLFLEEARDRGSYEEWVIGSFIQDSNVAKLEKLFDQCESSMSTLLFSTFSSVGGMLLLDFDCSEILIAFHRFEGDENTIIDILDRVRSV